jgi:dipeptidyl aminopeptidase/acylaminoacyl peptidase
MSPDNTDTATQPAEALWRQRFRGAAVTLPRWAIDAPERLVYASNQSGAWQVHAWDRAAGTHDQVTDHPTGVMFGRPTPDGEAVVWFEDARGDEIGRWLMRPFAGGDRRPLLPDVEPAWSAGLVLGPDGLAAVGLAGRDGFSVRVGKVGGPTREVYRHQESAGVSGLTRDGRLLLVSHSEHGDNIHPALRAFDTATGEVVADLWDGEGSGVDVTAVSPVPGDSRVAIERDRTGIHRPAIWDPATGQVDDLPVDLPGEVQVLGWWPDAGALLLGHTYMGRDELYRVEPSGDHIERIEHPPGTVGGAAVRPDGTIWYRWSSGANPPAVRAVGAPRGRSQIDQGDQVVLEPPGPQAPPGRPYRSWTFDNEVGQRVHGFVVEPEGSRPHPTIMLVHGGPTAQDADMFVPQVQAWVDHGFAVALVNYRGSAGYDKAWQDAVQGDPGRPEIEDVVAGRDDLIASGVADPERVVIAGASWGGYITLQTIGTVPDGWRAALAVVPVADYVAAYEDESEGLQAFDRSLFGGSPAEVPELYRDRSPITHVERVRTPVLLMVGENDTRCPLRQVLNYADRLTELGKPFELDRFDAGHGALVIDERIRQVGVLLDYAARYVPGVSKPQA